MNASGDRRAGPVHAGAVPTGGGAQERAQVLPDVVLLAVSLATGLGLARLTTAPAAWRVIGPIIATVVAGHLTTSFARRLRAPTAVAGACGVVAVALSTVWGQFLAATRSGIPTAAAWHAVGVRFAAGYGVIRAHPTPVPATAGVVLWVAAGAGLVAVLTRTAWAWHDGRGARPLVALVPSFGLFAYTALLSSEIDRVPGAISYLVSALAFVVVADAGTFSAGVGRLRAALPSAGAAVLAIVVPLAVSPVLGALKVDAVPFPTDRTAGGLSIAPSATGGGAQAGLGAQEPFGVQAINLVDNLQAVIVSRSDEVMFTATTPRPSYWQVAVLTLFNGTAWLPDPHTETAVQSIQVPVSRGSPSFLPVLPQTPPAKTFRAQITIDDLESTLLPLPSTVVSVDSDATYLAGFGAVRSYETSTGYSYSAEAALPVNAAAASGAPGATSVAGALRSGQVTPDDLDPYLQIPALSGRVIHLAHQIVAGATNPAAEAADLARWFNSGRFRYTLTPPASTGSDPLSAFLFTTRAGFCQQFAAAYAVLARIDGLPTRIAVGFTTGTPTGTDRYQVTGADAHVWPEVYLGPSVGWTSFEPTPATSGEPNGVGVDSGRARHGPGEERFVHGVHGVDHHQPTPPRLVGDDRAHQPPGRRRAGHIGRAGLHRHVGEWCLGGRHPLGPRRLGRRRVGAHPHWSVGVAAPVVAPVATAASTPVARRAPATARMAGPRAGCGAPAVAGPDRLADAPRPARSDHARARPLRRSHRGARARSPGAAPGGDHRRTCQAPGDPGRGEMAHPLRAGHRRHGHARRPRRRRRRRRLQPARRARRPGQLRGGGLHPGRRRRRGASRARRGGRARHRRSPETTVEERPDAGRGVSPGSAPAPGPTGASLVAPRRRREDGHHDLPHAAAGRHRPLEARVLGGALGRAGGHLRHAAGRAAHRLLRRARDRH